MRFPAAVLTGTLAMGAAAETADAPFSGLHVHVRSPIVNRGRTVHARVRWETGGSFFVAGSFTARWQLRSSDGRVVAHGRRPVRIAWNEEPPYPFSVGVRIPRRVNFDVLALEVALIDDASWEDDAEQWACGSAAISVETGRAYFWNGNERESFTGTLVDGANGVHLSFSENPGDYPMSLYGPGESAIRTNPAWQGASVTVTGRRFEGT